MSIRTIRDRRGARAIQWLVGLEALADEDIMRCHGEDDNDHDIIRVKDRTQLRNNIQHLTFGIERERSGRHPSTARRLPGQLSAGGAWRA